MDTDTLIDRIQDYTDDVASTDGDNAAYRLRVLQWTQQVYEYVWNYRSWKFKVKTDTVTISADASSAALPADFQEFGIHGGVYVQDSSGIPQQPKLEEAAPQIIQMAQSRSGTTGSPGAFSIYLAIDGRYYIQVPKLSGAKTFTLYYSPVAPTLVDSNVNSKLESIPAGYHFTVLLAGVQEKAARDKGDMRAASEWATIYRDGLKRMVERETSGRSSVQRMPRSSIGMW
jgi:hypothetical protein